MDVVRSNIERIGGIVEVDSRLGEGTRMTLRVPLTLTIIPALTVSIGSASISRSRARRSRRSSAPTASPSRSSSSAGAGVATIRGRRVPEVSLADILGLESDVAEMDRTLIVLRPAGGDLYALGGRSHPRSRGAGGQARGAGGDGDRHLCGHDAGRRRQSDPAVRCGGPRRRSAASGSKSQERSARIAESPAASTAVRGRPGSALPRPRRRPPRASPRGRRSHRGSPAQAVAKPRGPASRPARRGDRSACRRNARRARRREGPPVPPQRWRRTRSATPSAEVIDFAAIDNEVLHADRPGEVSGVIARSTASRPRSSTRTGCSPIMSVSPRAPPSAGLPPAERRSVDAEHAPPDGRGGRLSRRRRRATRQCRPRHCRAKAPRSPAMPRSSTIWLRTEPEPPARRTTASIATTAQGC